MKWGRNRKIRNLSDWARDAGSWLTCFTLRIARPAAVVAGIVALAFCAFTGWDRLHQSPQFRLAEVVVEGAIDMSAEEVCAACGLVKGHTNVVLTTAESVRKTCEADPRIRQAIVSIEPPARIGVKVAERRQELYAALPDGLWAVSPVGEVFAPVDPAAMRPLPILTGAEALLQDDPELPQLGPKAPESERNAHRKAIKLQLVRAEKRREILGTALSLARIVTRDPVAAWAGESLELAWDPIMGLTVSPLAGGLEARYGYAPFGRKHARLKRALATVETPTEQVTHAFLDNEARPHEVTVRLRPAPVSAASEFILEALP